MEKLNKETFYNKFKDTFNLNNKKFKFINSAYSVRDSTLKIFKDELEENEILFFQLIHFKTKEVINPNTLYSLETIDLPKEDIVISIIHECVKSIYIGEVIPKEVYHIENHKITTLGNIDKEEVIAPISNYKAIGIDLDKIIKPKYYKSKSGLDVIDVIADFDMDFLMGNCFKYIVRSGKKEDAIKDLEKAKEYIDRKIKMLENE